MKQHTCTKAQLSKFIWPAVWAVVRGQQDHDGQLSPIPPAKLRLIIDPWSVRTRLYTGPALCIVILLNLDTGPALCSSILK